MINIELNSLGKRYSFRWIFRKMDLKLNSGILYGVQGPNGSGKSTLLKIISGYLSSSEGSIQYNVSNQKLSREEIYSKVSMCAPYISLIDEFTVDEMLNFHFSLRAARESMSIGWILENCYLSDSRQTLVKHLSSGMLQRLKLAICLWTESAIYLLDEPGSNLDGTALRWYQETLSTIPPDSLLIVASNVKDDFPVDCVYIDLNQFKG